MCPSAKAAKRAAEVIATEKYANKPECKTAHMGLKWQEGRFIYSVKNKLPYDYVIMDEASMGGLMISHAFFNAIDSKKTRVILSGDPNQLPSVDPGNVYHDLIESGVAPSTYLNYLFRQGANSGIAYNAGRVLNGDPLSLIDPRTGEKFQDFMLAEIDDPVEAKKYIIDCIVNRIPAKFGYDSKRDIQLLCPGKRGEVGTDGLNESLRESLNPAVMAAKSFKGFRLGDKVICRKNDYNLGVVNGDVGIVVKIDDRGLVVDFGVGAGKTGNGKAEFGYETAGTLKLAYGYTVHSSQGSEFKCVVVPIYSLHHFLLFRNLFYTGITRARDLVLVVYQKKALYRALNNTVIDKRTTMLRKFLKQ
jgi:exodeoxyribonuclease V alpha subunit